LVYGFLLPHIWPLVSEGEKKPRARRRFNLRLLTILTHLSGAAAAPGSTRWMIIVGGNKGPTNTTKLPNFFCLSFFLKLA
jgi:hypothetical protein